MTMQLVNLIQGSPEWNAHRRKYLNASDAPAMMGCSPYKKRSELVKERATGITPEVDAITQRRFNDGHQFEALARPLGEQIIGEDLSPCVGTRGKYSASFDGLTFMNDVGFEHKTLNAELRELLSNECHGDDLPMHYRVQMEQQAMVSGAERILFMASKWTAEGLPVEALHCWYEPNAELRAQIIAGWEQLEKDVAAYDPNAERPAAVVAEPIESLPAVVVQVNGALTVGGNLEDFGIALRTFIDRIPKKPSTDQEFADAEAATKALKKAEDALTTAEDGALAQISDVEVMRRTVADLKNLARTARLATEKLVAAEKEARRAAIVTGAQAQLDQHITALNQRLGTNWLPRVAGGFGEVIKGKKSLANMDDAVAVALTNAKHEANQLADRLEANRKHLMQKDGDWIALFADFATVGTKAAEDFQALAALRIDRHKQAEADRLEAERERIRAEEAAKLQREAEAKERAEAEQAEREAQAQQSEADRINQLAANAAIDDAEDAAPITDQLPLEEPTKPAQPVAVQVPAAIKQVAAKAPIEQRVEAGQTMTLGQINALMGIFDVKATTLAALGIATEKYRGAVHMDACDFDAMCAKLLEHIQGVREHALKQAA